MTEFDGGGEQAALREAERWVDAAPERALAALERVAAWAVLDERHPEHEDTGLGALARTQRLMGEALTNLGDTERAVDALEAALATALERPSTEARLWAAEVRGLLRFARAPEPFSDVRQAVAAELDHGLRLWARSEERSGASTTPDPDLRADAFELHQRRRVPMPGASGTDGPYPPAFSVGQALELSRAAHDLLACAFASEKHDAPVRVDRLEAALRRAWRSDEVDALFGPAGVVARWALLGSTGLSPPEDLRRAWTGVHTRAEVPIARWHAGGDWATRWPEIADHLETPGANTWLRGPSAVVEGVVEAWAAALSRPLVVTEPPATLGALADQARAVRLSGALWAVQWSPERNSDVERVMEHRTGVMVLSPMDTSPVESESLLLVDFTESTESGTL